MKKLNITKDKFTESKYFTTKYGKLEYVSESGNLYKTTKGHVIMFNEADSVSEDLKLKAMAAAKLLGVIAFLGDEELDKKYELFRRQKNIRASKMADAILDIKAYRDAANKLNDERVGGKFVGSPDEY